MAETNRESPAEKAPKCGACTWNCIQAPYQRFLYRYGHFVGRHPWWFVVVPVIICLALTTGIIFNMTILTSANRLFTPKTSQTLAHRRRIHELFPMNSSREYVPEASVSVLQALVMIQTVNGKVLEERNLRRILVIDRYIRQNMTTLSGRNFEQLCAKWHGECVSATPSTAKINADDSSINDILMLLSEVNVTASTSAKIPLLTNLFGKVAFGPNSEALQNATYLSWSYDLREDVFHEARDWINRLYDVVEREELESPDLNVWMFSLLSVNKELIKSGKEIVPQFIITLTLMIVFSVSSCLMLDPVMSKPLLAVSGVVSPGLAIGGAFGLLFYAGQPYAVTVGLVPFLVIAIGVDGMFVLISAWRHTSSYLSCEERMALTFREGGVSITITALTDMIGMAVGIVNPFRGIELFCRFATLATAFDLILQLTFFAGCLALAGRREGTNRHSLVPCKVLPAPSQAKNSGKCMKLLCVGGVNKMEVNPLDNKEHLGSRIFGNHVAKWMTHPATIAVAVIVYLAYVGGAAYGCLNIKEGLRREDIALKGSKYHEMVQIFMENFQGKRSLMLVIDEPLTYSSHENQAKISSLLSELIQSKDAKVEPGNAWLQTYNTFLEQREQVPKNESDFIYQLRQFLLTRGNEGFKVDVAFSPDKSVILASRFYLTGPLLDTTDNEKRSYLAMKAITDKHELNAFVFNSLFQFTEQYVLIVPNTIQVLGIATSAMFVISLLFLPNPLIAFVVALSIVSIEAGLVGYMSLWDVRMDIIAMMSMLISVGFVVDFSAHLAYAFVTTTEQDRLKHALSLIGYPLLQSSVSTIIGVLVLIYSLSAIARTFFKIMFLLMIFGSLHGLLWIPLILHFTIGCFYKQSKQGGNNHQTSHSFSTQPEPLYSLVNKRHQRGSNLPQNGQEKHFPNVQDNIIQMDFHQIKPFTITRLDH